MPNRLLDPTVAFPETLLMEVPRDVAVTDLQRIAIDRARRHNRTVQAFTRSRSSGELQRPERAILSLMAGIEGYIDSAPSLDGVSIPAIGAMLFHFGDLLNYELGRLDGATLSEWSVRTAERIGWDLNTNDWPDRS